TTYVRPIPPGLSPAEDVELILPLGRFDSVLAGQVAELLKTVKPWGQTPLYRSLVETQRDFDSDEAGTDKHVVVISDGANYQFTLAASGQFAAPHPTELADVVAAWGKHQPAIHIVGFGIPEAERVDAERAFRQLVDRTKGSYETSAVEAQALLGKLDELLAKSTYTIRNAAGQDVGAAIEQNGSISPRRGPVRLGEPLVVSPVLRGPQSYTLSCQVASVPLRLRGGEHAELVLSDDGRRVENVTYLEGSPKFGRLLNGRLGAPTGLLVGVHRPLAERDGLRFTLSLQHENRRFVPRPAEVWIEITPLLADGSTVAPYCFYDAEFAPSAPVPALSWVANGWPDNGSQAAVRFWCKDEATPPEVTIPLSKIPAAPADRQQFPAFPGVRLQLETVQQNEVFGVRVVEWHEPESEGVGSLKVELARPLEGKLRPQRVLHLLDTEHRVAAHLFLFTTWDPQAASSFEIRLTKAASVKDEAQQLDQSLEVSLTENVELIAPGIPTTPR
ncbi:MAG: hypothetical protein NTY19_32315, partial [Planctomycetota bacterium]|nr:hypothetical protein [Planctomycetota bacterium]